MSTNEEAGSKAGSKADLKANAQANSGSSSTWLATFEVVHAAGLALWMGVLVMSGVVAAVAFPTMKRLDPKLPGFEAVGEHWKIAAGSVAFRVFTISDALQLVCVIVTLATLGLGLSLRSKEPNGVKSVLLAGRAILMSVASGLVGYQLFVLGPRMSENIAKYWAFAREGKVELASAAQAAFEVDHPTASSVLYATLACVVVMLACVIIQSRGLGRGAFRARAGGGA